MQQSTIHKGKFLDLKLVEGLINNKPFKYEFLHESRCDGHIVAVLPVHERYGMMIRKETTPCWGEGPFTNSITGGWEKSIHETPIDTVIAEVREEAGLQIMDEEAIFTLGTCRAGKSADTLYHLFLVDLSKDDFTEVDVEPDGVLESAEWTEWVKVPYGASPEDAARSCEWLAEASDPLIYVMYMRWAIAGLARPVTRDFYKKEEE